jgi:hypothetical protein
MSFGISWSKEDEKDKGPTYFGLINLCDLHVSFNLINDLKKFFFLSSSLVDRNYIFKVDEWNDRCSKSNPLHI